MRSDVADTLMRMTAFTHVLKLSETQNNISAEELRRGFTFEGERIPLVNPQRGIFKPRQMQYLLSIRTVFPRPGKRVWYDDQRQVHSQIFESREAVDYAFMGNNPDAADNRWLLEAFENRVPVIYFLGVAPGLYQAIIPTYISGWDADALKARIVFGIQDQTGIQDQADYVAPESVSERRYALQMRISRQSCHRLHGKVATHFTRKLPPITRQSCHPPGR